MDAIQFLKEKKRMCDSVDDCADCALCEERNGFDISCGNLGDFEPEYVVAAVERWGKEHLVKTMLMDFLEKYPNAVVFGNGIPRVCPYHLGYEIDCHHCSYKSCVECWNRPLPREGE